MRVVHLRQRFACLTVLAGALCLSPMALAVDVLSVTVTNTPISLGKIVRSNSGATAFTVTNAGAVSVASGSGVRVTSGAVNVLSLSLDCVQSGGTSKCSRTNSGVTKNYRFTITAGATTGGDTLNKFSYGSLTSGTLIGSAPTAANPLIVNFNRVSGQTWPITLTLGYEFGVSATATRGAATAPYTITLTEY